jgi:chemotaxis protein methyltransferase CheR
VIALAPETLVPFKALLLDSFGLAFENERERTLTAGLERRMALQGGMAPDRYLAMLQGQVGERESLVQLLTVNETYFLREPAYLHLLVDHLVPERLREGGGRPLRILCAGCSSGEEPYSIAMLLKERFGPDAPIQVCGIDLDAGAIDAARKGVYGVHAFRGVDPAFRARHFERIGASWRVNGALRERVTFEVANLVAGAFPPCMDQVDILFYRNVSIYFPASVQRRVFTRLAGLLEPGGYLLVGATETLFHDFGRLALVEREGLYLFQDAPRAEIRDRRACSLGAARLPPAQLRRKHPPRCLSRKAPSTGHAVAERRRASEAPEAPQIREPFDQALGLAGSGHLEAALDQVEKLLMEEPAFLQAHTLKSAILLEHARYPEARSACERAILLDPLSVEAMVMLGIIARQEGDEDAAMKRFREALFLDGDCWIARYYLAVIHLARGDRRKARGGFEAVLRTLGAGPTPAGRRTLFPLQFNADDFIAICRHHVRMLDGTD